MSSPDKALGVLLELGSPAERWTRNELLDRALRTLQALTDADAVTVLTTSRGQEERIALYNGSPVLAVLQPTPAGSAVVRTLSEDPTPLAIQDLADELKFADSDSCPGLESGPVVFCPLRQRGLAPAYLAAYRRRGRARISLHDVRATVLLGAWLDAAFESYRLASTREKLVVGEEGTSIYRYRFLRTALEQEIRRAHRFGQEVSIAKFQIDDPEPGVAPAVWSEIAAVLASQVRSFDLLGKSDHDTLMVVLPQTTRKGGVDMAERARAAVESHGFSSGSPGSVTLSAGVASFPRDGGDVDKLLAAADLALQKAKQQGKNSVATPTRKAA